MSAATLASPAVADFAAAVRAALSDLTPDEVDDLTDGLEADLTERLEESDAAELGDPAAYAEELRTAAGLPHRATPGARMSFVAGLRALPTTIGREAGDFAQRHPAVAAVGPFFRSIRPVWWLFRAALITGLFASFFVGYGYSYARISGPSVLLFVAVAIVSIQFGRGKWLPFAWMRVVLLIANVILVIASPFAVAAVASEINAATYAMYDSEDSYADDSSSGLMLDGNQVSNVFAYDAEGRPLTDVQLFDQDGKPLNLVGDATMQSGDFTDQNGNVISLVPNQSVSGRLGWNVYPLAHVGQSDLNDDGSIKHSAVPVPADAPFAAARPLADADATPSPIPTAGATAVPSATPTPAP